MIISATTEGAETLRRAIEQSRAKLLASLYASDGARVRCAAMLQLKGGKIAQQVNVQAWDE